MTYTEHQQEEFVRQMARKWHWVLLLTSPFVVVCIIEIVLYFIDMMEGRLPPLVIQISLGHSS